MNQIRLEIVAFFLLLVGAVNVWGEEIWPEGMSFVGLGEGRWQLYLVPSAAAEPRAIATASEPRTPTYAPGTGKLAYIGAGGALREIVLESGVDQVLLSPDALQTFTQPAYDAAGKRLFVVVLKEGASVDTDIVVLDGDRPRPIVTQRSAQFEPRFQTPNTLYYSNVLCTIGCGKIIQELWRMNLVSGQADQLTLVNAIARQPAVSRDDHWLYFASNKAGNFHIWRLALATGRYEQLTAGRVTDTSPALDRADNLYFIRRSPAGVQLMRRKPDGALQPLSLPDAVEDVRDLEINP